jgi:hypothetical protein
MHRAILALLSLFILTAPAAAVVVSDCNDDEATASAANLAEPWEKNTKVFYHGDVRVALIDTDGEPVCCSMRLLILSPNQGDGAEYRACHIVNDHGGLGFVGIDFAKLTARYDAGKGLLIAFPYELYNSEGGPQQRGTGKVRINVATGAVTPER